MFDDILQEACRRSVCGQRCYNFIYFYNTLFSGFCLFIAMILAGIQTFRHLRNYTNPHFQNKILSIYPAFSAINFNLGIVFAAPFYGITSFLVIVTKDSIGFWIVLRSIYDSFLIYFFFNLITSYVAYDEGVIDMDIMYDAIYEKEEIAHSFPFHWCLKPIKIRSIDRARFFYLTCKNNMMQFFVLSILMTFLNCIAALVGSLQIWIDINNGILFISISFCLYYLMLFYTALKKELKEYNPLLKFLAIKGIIFFTFWQEMAIGLFRNKLIHLFDTCDIKDFKEQYIINSASCMLVCFEMIILTIMTSIAYSYKDFESATTRPMKKRLIFNVITENFKDQFEDLASYDILKDVAFKKKVSEAVITEKESTTKYVDEKGNTVDAKYEQATRLYQDRIEVIPDSICASTTTDATRGDYHQLDK